MCNWSQRRILNHLILLSEMSAKLLQGKPSSLFRVFVLFLWTDSRVMINFSTVEHCGGERQKARTRLHLAATKKRCCSSSNPPDTMSREAEHIFPVAHIHREHMYTTHTHCKQWQPRQTHIKQAHEHKHQQTHPASLSEGNRGPLVRVMHAHACKVDSPSSWTQTPSLPCSCPLDPCLHTCYHLDIHAFEAIIPVHLWYKLFGI